MASLIDSEVGRSTVNGIVIGSRVRSRRRRKDAWETVYRWESPTRKESWKYLRQVWITTLPLLVGDLLVATAGLSAAYLTIGSAVGLGLPAFEMSMAALLGMSLLIHWCLGLYPGVGMSPSNELRLTVYASIISHASLALGSWCFSGITPWLWVASLAISLAASPLLRRIIRNFMGRRAWWGQPAIIFGSGSQAAAVYRALLAAPQQGLRPIGMIDELAEHWRDEDVDPAWYLGPLSEAQAIIRSRHAWWGILMVDGRTEDEIAHRLDQVAHLLPHLVLTSGPGGALTRRTVHCQDLGSIPGVRIDERLLLPLPSFTKRLMDLAFVITGGILVLPLMAVLALLVWLTSPGPIFYGQVRIGRGGSPFRAWKFRSMVLNADKVLADYLAMHPELHNEWQRNHKLKQDPRITPVGRFLRKVSLDELPQLWNVLVGEMSLVGPRPIVRVEIAKYRNTYNLYRRVRPGITGLWQINGRNNTTYQERLDFDTVYIRNWSPWLDMQILVSTIDVVLRCKGAY